MSAKKKPTESAGDSILIVKSAPKIYQVCKSISRTGLSSAVTSSSSIMSTAVEGGDVVNESDSQVASLTKIPTVTQVKVESKEDIQGSETQQNGNSSQSTQDSETRSASPFTKLESSTEPLEAVQVEFDPSSIMTWTDGVGSLPGSELQFKLDDSGNLEMIDDEEANNIRKEHQERRARGIPDPVVVAKPLAAAKIVEEENKEPNVAPMKRKKCANCGKVGDGSRFVRAGKFCSQDCATSQANQLRMMASAASSVRPGASLISRSDSSSASKPKSLLFDNNHHSKGRHTDNGSRSSSPGTKAKRHKSDSDHGHENDRRKSSETSSSFIPKKDAIGMKGAFARMKNRFDLNDRNSNNDSLPSSPSSSLVNITPQSALQQSIFSMRVMQHQPPIAWDRHSANLRPLLKDIRPLEVLKWLPDQVSSFVNSIPGCQEIGQTFSDEVSKSLCLFHVLTNQSLS